MKQLTLNRIVELLARQGEMPVVIGHPLAGIETMPLEPGGLAKAVLLNGPMFELRRVADRLAALDEARRSLHRGGLVAALAVSRFARLFDPQVPEAAHTHTPADLAAELTRAGFISVEVVAVEGPFWLAGKPDSTLLRRIESEPSLLGASLHLLALGRKP